MIARLRKICLALTEAEERETWERPTFRVRDKIFCIGFPDQKACWFKAPRGSQELLIEADGARFFRPPYLGHKGWVGMRLDGKPDWKEVESFLQRSYSLVAPKVLAKRITTD